LFALWILRVTVGFLVIFVGFGLAGVWVGGCCCLGGGEGFGLVLLYLISNFYFIF
jgi:hypothetical protein